MMNHLSMGPRTAATRARHAMPGRITFVRKLTLVASTLWLGCVQSTDVHPTSDAAPPVNSPGGSVAASTSPSATIARAAPASNTMPSDVQRTCAEVCKRSADLRCSQAAQCEPNCTAMAVGTPCGRPMAALYTCLVKQPLQHWECAEDGTAAIRDGFCDKEQENVVHCMDANMPSKAL